jgi:hypothetical protein
VTVNDLLPWALMAAALIVAGIFLGVRRPWRKLRKTGDSRR